MRHAPPPRHLLAGALLAVAAELMFASMGAVIKALAADLPTAMIVFLRNLAGLVVIAPWLLRRGGPGLRTRHPGLLALRALAGLGAMYCFFYAIGHIPLAEAVLLKMTAPLFLPLIALAWLGERSGPRVAGAVVLGFAGVALILRPGLSGLDPVALVALAGGALAALAKVSVRRLAGVEPGSRIVFYFALIATAVSALPALAAWRNPGAEAWLLIAAMGLLATTGQLLMTRAYGAAPAPFVGPFTYATVPFAALYGWLFWGERLDALTVLGAAVVAAAGALTLSTRRGAPAPRGARAR